MRATARLLTELFQSQSIRCSWRLEGCLVHDFGAGQDEISSRINAFRREKKSKMSDNLLDFGKHTNADQLTWRCSLMLDKRIIRESKRKSV